MSCRRSILCLAASTFIACWTAGAQGVTGSGVYGNVNAPDRSGTIRVLIRHDSTGYSIEVPVSHGRFFIQNLEPGGPYTLTTRAVGFRPARRANVVLALGELRRVDFVLHSLAETLDTVIVAAGDDVLHRGVHADGGTGMSITSAQLEKLPTLNRDLYDFVRLVPQISTKISLASPGVSAAGTGFRFNNFQINGVSDRTLSGSLSTPGGTRSISLDAVKEYQVLLSPYDVRYGDFAGALVNAVTKAGTNDLRGSMFVYGRTDDFARDIPADSVPPYERVQYGFSLGGPIVRDRVHFFVASDFQHFTFPAPGPYLGQPENAPRPLPVSLSDLERFEAIMRSFDLTPGSAAAVENSRPLLNLYSRLDVALPELNSRVVFSHNYGAGDEIDFSRRERDVRTDFPLTSSVVERKSRFRTTAGRIHTALRRAGGGDNELILSYRRDRLEAVPSVFQPIVRVAVRPVSGSALTLTAGTPDVAQGPGFRASSLQVRNTLTLPFGSSHVVTTGAELERFTLRRGTARVSYGTWTFASLTDFALGVPERYDVRIGFEPSDVPLRGTQYAAYLSDRWQIGDRLMLTAGLRGDVLDIGGHAPYNPVIDSLFSRRTDAMPRVRVELSPRAGFKWQPSPTNRDQLRGGIGIFASRYPLGWAHTAQTAFGAGGTLTCGGATGRGPPPVFSTDYRNPPIACSGGNTVTSDFQGDVNLLDRKLRMMRVLRSSLAYDRQLSRSVVFTNEALFSRALSDFVAVNLKLGDPVGADANGRVMYGELTPAGQYNPPPGFTEVIDLRNTSRNHSWSLATRLERKQAAGFTGFLSYTFSRARDVQTLTRVNNRGTVLWGSARVTSGRHDRLAPDISSNDIPHRIVVAGTYARPWRFGRSEVSFYYVGESGRPFTYVASGESRRGDLNADGSNINDPIYVPLDAGDSTEIRISSITERAAFESFIERMPCLRSQRGKILARNSCREPWSNVTIASLRHSIPVAGRSLEMQMDIFNVLNLLKRSWGQWREADPALLEHVGQIVTSSQSSMPLFRFDTTSSEWNTSSVESSYQLQLAVRYRI